MSFRSIISPRRSPAGSGPDALGWLLRLRWAAVVGQSVTVLVVTFLLNIFLPLPTLFAFIAVTAGSNLAVQFWLRHCGTVSGWLPGTLIALDVLVLTGLLALTGGPGNPFATFYLVPAMIASVLLSQRGTWAVWALCSLGYAALFGLRAALPQLHLHEICGPAMNYNLHLRGMLVALVLTGAAGAYFMGRMNQSLRAREHELARARAREAENEHFASIATLAAGVAHEIGSPLGTIAIAAGELRHAAAQLAPDSTIREDAELIAEEVARCRAILDRLNDRSGMLGDLPRRLAAGELVAAVQCALPAAQGARLHAVIRDPTLFLFVPPTAMTQALGVLVKNAFDASAPDQPVQLTAEEVSGEVRFSIEDQGTGLTEAARVHAGEPFFTTKEPGRGLGLGLFLVRLLAQRLNGSLRLETTPSGGTRAVLAVPRPLIA